MLCAFAALVTATMGFGNPPTMEEALDYAKAVVLFNRVVKDGNIHA